MILTPQSPLSWVSDRVIQTGYLLTVQTVFQISTWKTESFSLKIYLLQKICPISEKRWNPYGSVPG